MTNKDIIKKLKLTASLLDLHGENPFKVKGYNNAVFNLERYGQPLHSLNQAQLAQINGVGKTIAAAIDEINRTGQFSLLNRLLDETPPGVVDMLGVGSVGPKKIGVLWKELNIENINDLIQACNEGKVAKLKGFGEKTQDNIKQALLYSSSNAGSLHYAAAVPIAQALVKQLKDAFPEALVSVAGQIRRKLEIIDQIVILVGTRDLLEIGDYLDEQDSLTKNVQKSGPFAWRGHFNNPLIDLEFLVCEKAKFYNHLLLHTGSKTHLSALIDENQNLIQKIAGHELQNEDEAYKLAGMAYVAPELREGLFEIPLAKEDNLPGLVEMGHLRGVLHNHSTYSDGKHSLETMAEHCKQLGYEYLGITDHSKSAIYANGLYEEAIQKQQAKIDSLNNKLAPFKIFKGIESDILNDGSLDYDEATLKSFDFIVASIHTNLRMDIKKATDRLVKAVSNPFTTILGHPTGRLLLRREGYPIDHKTVIDACAEYGVIIEVNANPWRLDLDWRWINYALEQNVLISINPDAHDKESYQHMYYGVCIARKGGLSPDRTFNSFPVKKVEEYFIKRKENAVAAVSE